MVYGISLNLSYPAAHLGAYGRANGGGQPFDPVADILGLFGFNHHPGFGFGAGVAQDDAAGIA